MESNNFWNYVDNVEEVKSNVEKIKGSFTNLFKMEAKIDAYLGGANMCYQIGDHHYQITIYANEISLFFWIMPSGMASCSSVEEVYEKALNLYSETISFSWPTASHDGSIVCSSIEEAFEGIVKFYEMKQSHIQ